MQTILAIFAHPDDEVFAAGGVLAKYGALGVHTVLLCATRGEVGEISDPALATPETLAEVRTRELEQAVHALGIHELHFLGFRDSGMVGTPENEDARSLHKADANEAVRRLVHLMRTVKPDLVITHDPTGGYGHPDHIAVCKHVTSAFAAVSDGQRFAEDGPAWQPSRLYYQVVPKSFFRMMHEQMVAAGVDTSQWDRLGFDKLGVEDHEITHIVDVSAQFEQKMAAFAAHKTQFGPDNPMQQMPEAMQRQVFGRETFVLAVPPKQVEGGQSQDLFT
ncbi:MAG: PIG-L family deacetylase [Caldilineaceae bacterium]